MKITTNLLSIGLIGVLALAGCASQPKMTQEQILNQYQQVDKLDTALQKARKEGAELLAPESYAKAKSSLDRAMSEARDNESKAADAAAADGLKAIDKLNRDAASSRDILAEVLQSRDRAYKAGAKTLQSSEIAALDEDLKKTAAMIEKGSLEQAKQRRPKLVSEYSALELTALKQGTEELAKAAIVDAKKHGANKFAPKTLAQAEEEMALAVTILDADRTQTDKANVHSEKAKWLAQKSAAIAETVKDFDRRDYSMEDVVLWHQQQLATVNQPLGGQLPFNEPSDKVVLGLRGAVSTALDERDMARDQAQQAEKKIAAQMSANQNELAKLRAQYESQLAMTEKDRKSLQEKERMEQQKFEQVQAMFSESEAKVYRQRNNVLISVHGFQFPTGQSEIQTDNFPLMNKITRAIKAFPKARIEVTGHTDSTGGDTANQALSQARAEKVAKFLKEVGEIAPENIKARGFGEAKPVASNETQEGRAENRRVEIAIVNE